MEIRGPQFGRYDAQHIQQVQREIARSIKPNVLRELEEEDFDSETLFRLLTEDEISLSPEAREILEKLRRRMKRRRRRKDEDEEVEESVGSLLSSLEELKAQADEEREKQLPKEKKEKPKFFVPPVIQLSGSPMGRPRAAHQSNIPSSDTAKQIARMVAYAPKNESKYQIMREHEVFGFELVDQVRKFGTKIIILEPNFSLADLKIKGMYVIGRGEKTFDGRDWRYVRGLYDSSRRLLVMGEELLGMPKRSTARHEFAHAYEHAYSTKKRRRLPLSVELWNAFADQRTGLVSHYASTNPAEYFAESVEAFFEEGPRAFLKKADPQMHAFLSELFKAA